jgi:hypothetical protein
MEDMFLIYILHHVPAHTVELEHYFCLRTVSDWAEFCKEAMLFYAVGCSQKIGSPKKTVEMDENKLVIASIIVAML